MSVVQVFNPDDATASLQTLSGGLEELVSHRRLDGSVVEMLKRLKLHWADERQWCRAAIMGEEPATCPMLAVDEDSPDGYCTLNAHSIAAHGPEVVERRTPCIFDEPADAPIWQKVARWRTRLPPGEDGD